METNHKAFVEFLRKRHGTIERLQKRWDMTPEQLPAFETVVPPEDTINSQQLVTVGQDEALGRWPKPSLVFYAEAVDAMEQDECR